MDEKKILDEFRKLVDSKKIENQLRDIEDRLC